MNLWFLVTLLLAVCPVHANVKAVFAHFMVSNTGTYTIEDWQDDITLARDSKIDGFVLNMAKDEATNGDSLKNAFIAANNLGSTFKLLFSFDYAGNGLWPADQVISLIQKYSSDPAYYYRGSQPLVSTFEGPKASPDWPSIKAATNCFFIPSWSSLGAKPAWDLGTADGLFSWAAWPTGPNNMDTFTDSSYLDTLNGKPYIMGVSPWFYTNLPGFRKNWLWRGDSLWFDRWMSVFFLQPEYVEIISWNDYGESHHIGPLRDNAYDAFDKGKAPFIYAAGKDHDAWRLFLPYLIDMAKTNATSFNEENIVAWYRPHPKNACGTGGTTGNTASQLQQVYAPGELVEDEVFFAALLSSSATVTVTIGGVASGAEWTYAPSNGVGLYRGSAGFDGRTGAVTITVSRGGATILSSTGDAISTSCTNGMQNWNPYVIAAAGQSISAVSPAPLNEVGCTSGFGATKYRNLCKFACEYDYCPRGACTCTSMGPKKTRPKAKNLNACPAPGIDTTYLGLCSFVCNYDTCPDVCTVYPADHICVAPLPVAPPVPVCISGMADGAYAAMCSFSCKLGFCPPEICSCTQAGTSNPTSPSLTDAVGAPKGDDDYGLCAYTCKRGVCPIDLCTCSGSGCPTSSGDGDSGSTTAGGSFFEVTNDMAIRGIKGELGENCMVLPFCLDQDDPAGSSCQSGYTKIGWDKDTCTGYKIGRSICCPTGSILKPDNCKWQTGIQSDDNTAFCNGQCLAGQVTVRTSPWGDASDGRCIRGTKAFCCNAPQINLAFAGCHWTGCAGDCSASGEISVATSPRYCFSDQLNGTPRASHLCCPTNTPLSSCNWKGTAPSCDDSDCPADEVTIAHGDEGAWLVNPLPWDRCSRWAGTKSLCCRITVPEPEPVEPELSCSDFDICQDFPSGCLEEESPDNEVDSLSRRVRRNVHAHSHSHSHSHLHALEKRARTVTSQRRPRLILRRFTAMPYWPTGDYIQQFIRRGWDILWYRQGFNCIELEVIRHLSTTASDVPASELHSEHMLDLQVIMHFAEFTTTGSLANVNIVSSRFFNNRISAPWWDSTFITQSLPPGIARVTGGSADLRTPQQRIFEVIGSTTNPLVMILLNKSINMIKGSLISASPPLTIENFEARVLASLADYSRSTEDWLKYIVDSVSVFTYINQPEIAPMFTQLIADIRAQWQVIDDNLPGASLHLAERWDEFIKLYLEESATFAQSYVRELTGYAMMWYQRASPPDLFRITMTIHEATQRIPEMNWPGYPL